MTQASDTSSSKKAPSPKMVCVGAFAGAHGVRGRVRIKAFTTNPMTIATFTHLYSENGKTQYKLITASSAGKDILLANIEGLTSREQASQLKSTKVYVPRETLPETDEEEFYHADLVGLTAVTADGAPFGMIRSVLNFGAQDVLEIEPIGCNRRVLLPFTKVAVPSVKVSEGQVTIDPSFVVEDKDADLRKPELDEM